jgi:hypothetical protein
VRALILTIAFLAATLAFTGQAACLEDACGFRPCENDMGCLGGCHCDDERRVCVAD